MGSAGTPRILVPIAPGLNINGLAPEAALAGKPAYLDRMVMAQAASSMPQRPPPFSAMATLAFGT